MARRLLSGIKIGKKRLITILYKIHIGIQSVNTEYINILMYLSDKYTSLLLHNKYNSSRQNTVNDNWNTSYLGLKNANYMI